jgi:hypothetical protein
MAKKKKKENVLMKNDVIKFFFLIYLLNNTFVPLMSIKKEILNVPTVIKENFLKSIFFKNFYFSSTLTIYLSVTHITNIFSIQRSDYCFLVIVL